MIRKFLFLFTIIVLSTKLFAQIEVKKNSFKEVKGFVNINTEKMTDDNDQPYAVLKIKTENINDQQRHELHFGGDAQTFIETEYHDGEVWLYISYYATYIKISHKDLSSTEFYFPFDMRPKCGYEVTLVNKSSKSEGVGTLKLTTIPAGATIIMDGITLQQKTPYFNDILAAGIHEITVLKDRYKSVKRIVEIKAGKVENMSIELPIDVAIITVKADDNTDVLIDGEMVGTGTWIGELKSGIHEIMCRKNYHSSVSETINVEANQPKEYELRPIPIYGGIKIDSEPNGASVYFDGKYYGTTPIHMKSITVGPHELQIDKTGYKVSKRSVVVEKNDTLIINEKLKAGVENKSFTVDGVSFEMVAVKGGTFKMGAQTTFYKGDNYDLDADRDESPIIEVGINEFYIGKYEVTQELWAVVMEKNPPELIDDDYPVNYIDIYEAMDFCNRLSVKCGKTPCYLKSNMIKIDKNANGFRLPTEEQWEYAARGGVERNSYKYSGDDDLEKVGWFSDNSGNKIHQVGMKAPNEIGLYDMSGNVKEWSESKQNNYDYYNTKYYNNTSSSSGRVVRGGGFKSKKQECRVSKRETISTYKKSADVGFRVVLNQ